MVVVRASFSFTIVRPVGMNVLHTSFSSDRSSVLAWVTQRVSTLHRSSQLGVPICSLSSIRVATGNRIAYPTLSVDPNEVSKIGFNVPLYLSFLYTQGLEGVCRYGCANRRLDSVEPVSAGPRRVFQRTNCLFNLFVQYRRGSNSFTDPLFMHTHASNRRHILCVPVHYFEFQCGRHLSEMWGRIG